MSTKKFTFQLNFSRPWHTERSILTVHRNQEVMKNITVDIKIKPASNFLDFMHSSWQVFLKSSVHLIKVSCITEAYHCKSVIYKLLLLPYGSLYPVWWDVVLQNHCFYFFPYDGADKSSFTLHFILFFSAVASAAFRTVSYFHEAFISILRSPVHYLFCGA